MRGLVTDAQQRALTVDEVLARGQGNPFFTAELVAAHLGTVVVEDHAARTGGALVYGRDEVGQRCSLGRGVNASSMMAYMGDQIRDIAEMPRGGPPQSEPLWGDSLPEEPADRKPAAHEPPDWALRHAPRHTEPKPCAAEPQTPNCRGFAIAFDWRAIFSQ